jgi:hypothetical protein
MKDRINEDLICVLKTNELKRIEISYLQIINPFQEVISNIVSICDNPSYSLIQVAEKISNFNELKLLNAQYKYCNKLDRPFQGFTANFQKFINDIYEKEREVKNNVIKQKKFDPKIERLNFKNYIKETLLVWSKASSINNAYERCYKDKSVIAFSHRLCGWSNPVFPLTDNFSVEIKTNFGYGNSSYFYTKLKYKNIEITPFSEYVDYEIARFSEIIRYTKSHDLENEYWLEAMEFCQEACNLSIQDESQFVQKYIIEECEKMVFGLEDFFQKEQFSFKHKKKASEKIYKVDKTGHVLIEFRGEKISGALDFVTKILEFNHIIQIKSFITRIEDCNRRIKPILLEELEKLKVTLSNLNLEMNEFYPIFKVFFDKNQKYLKERIDIKNIIIHERKIMYKELDDNEVQMSYPRKL